MSPKKEAVGDYVEVPVVSEKKARKKLRLKGEGEPHTPRQETQEAVGIDGSSPKAIDKDKESKKKKKKRLSESRAPDGTGAEEAGAEAPSTSVKPKKSKKRDRPSL